MFCPQYVYKKGLDGKLYLVYVNKDKSIVNTETIESKYKEFNEKEQAKRILKQSRFIQFLKKILKTLRNTIFR